MTFMRIRTCLGELISDELLDNSQVSRVWYWSQTPLSVITYKSACEIYRSLAHVSSCKHPACTDQWREFDGQRSNGGKLKTRFLVETCKIECESRESCVAIDYKDDGSCYLHSGNAGNADDPWYPQQKDKKGLTQYRLIRCSKYCNEDLFFKFTLRFYFAFKYHRWCTIFVLDTWFTNYLNALEIRWNQYVACNGKSSTYVGLFLRITM